MVIEKSKPDWNEISNSQTHLDLDTWLKMFGKKGSMLSSAPRQFEMSSQHNSPDQKSINVTNKNHILQKESKSWSKNFFGVAMIKIKELCCLGGAFTANPSEDNMETTGHNTGP